MQLTQGYRYELRPTGAQARSMRRTVGACRYVYNRALTLHRERYAAGEKKLGYPALCRELTSWRNDPATIWLADSPAGPEQQALRDLEAAYTGFFAKRAGAPRFRKKGRHERFRYPDPKQIRLDEANDRVFLPRLGWVRYRNSRPALGELRFVTVSERAGRWYMSVQTRREVEVPIPDGPAVGLDLGITRFATLSNGTWHPPANAYRTHETKLKKAQRAMSRKRPGSRNRAKATLKVRRIHARIGHVRNDHLHKLSSAIGQSHAVVFVERLQVRAMSGSAAGTAERPGVHVRSKAGLNKAIRDQGWSRFVGFLDYKLARRGGQLVKVNPVNTSRTCPACAHVAAGNRPTRSRFACVACGHADHADVVGAINIERAGHARLACEASGERMPPAAGTRRGDPPEPLAPGDAVEAPVSSENGGMSSRTKSETSASSESRLSMDKESKEHRRDQREAQDQREDEQLDPDERQEAPEDVRQRDVRGRDGLEIERGRSERR